MVNGLVSFNKRIIAKVFAVAMAAIIAFAPISSPFAAVTKSEKSELKDIVVVQKESEVVVSFEFDKAVSVNQFSIGDPARVVVDVDGASNVSGIKKLDINGAYVDSLYVIDVADMIRMQFDLLKMVDYKVKQDNNVVVVTFSKEESGGKNKVVDAASYPDHVVNFDFRSGDNGEGLAVLEFANLDNSYKVSRDGESVVVDFDNAVLPDYLHADIDVSDFNTKVKSVKIFPQDASGVRMVILGDPGFGYETYQVGSEFTLRIHGAKEDIHDALQEKKRTFSGETMSLDMQDIDIRRAIQMIAQFTGINIVVADTVQGSLTLRVNDLPWDQVLDIILRSKGLDYRLENNLMFIAPRAEISRGEKEVLENQQEIRKLAALYSEYIQVNYAKASEVKDIIGSEQNSFLSERGQVSVDNRTNTLLVRDTAENIKEVRRLVKRLDVPVKQVLIEGRVVIANDNFARDIGVKFGVSGNNSDSIDGDGVMIIGGKIGGDVSYGGATAFADSDNSSERLLFALPALNATSAIGLALGKVGSQLLQLELSAMQADGDGEVVSSPRLVAANQQEALIEQGVEIPYQENAGNGSTSVSFRKAVLSLKVKPHITPDNSVIMDLQINKDSVGEIFSGIPSINTRELKTRVLVKNGETVVLGGIYEQSKTHQTRRVPFFGDLPMIGSLFRNTSDYNDKSELLIFVTPRIIEESNNLESAKSIYRGD